IFYIKEVYSESKWSRLSELHMMLIGKDFAEAHDALVNLNAALQIISLNRYRLAIDIINGSDKPAMNVN
ncbi:MAG: hypothetical protein GY790_22325, partial [Bacteroidetes bacterium]|nr:hypothetical protein [Bacteroidota bacterium]